MRSISLSIGSHVDSQKLVVLGFASSNPSPSDHLLTFIVEPDTGLHRATLVASVIPLDRVLVRTKELTDKIKSGEIIVGHVADVTLEDVTFTEDAKQLAQRLLEGVTEQAIPATPAASPVQGKACTAPAATPGKRGRKKKQPVETTVVDQEDASAAAQMELDENDNGSFEPEASDKQTSPEATKQDLDGVPQLRVANFEETSEDDTPSVEVTSTQTAELKIADIEPENDPHNQAVFKEVPTSTVKTASRQTLQRDGRAATKTPPASQSSKKPSREAFIASLNKTSRDSLVSYANRIGIPAAAIKLAVTDNDLRKLLLTRFDKTNS